ILTANTPDANAGLYLYSDKFFLGLSDLHMLDNKIKFKNPQAPQGRVVPHYYGVIGYNFKAGKVMVIQPSVLLKLNQPTKVQPEYNLKVIYNNIFWVAGNYRTDDAVAFLMGVTVIKKLNIAYSYDYSITSIRKYNQGSHEIMLNYNFIKKKKDEREEEEFKIIDNSVHQSIKNKKDDKKDDKPKTEEKKEEKKEDNGTQEKKPE
ncbi:MAG: PorP/SprF family type IX secretion system membrane protein, partial [Bacteroidia bacterium]